MGRGWGESLANERWVPGLLIILGGAWAIGSCSSLRRTLHSYPNGTNHRSTKAGCRGIAGWTEPHGFPSRLPVGRIHPRRGHPIASRLRGNWSKGNASRNCCPVHSAVGWPVTLKWTMRRRSPANTRDMLRTWKPRVGRPAAGGDVQEGTPSLRGRLARVHRVFVDAGLTDLNAEFEQFTVLRDGTSPVCLGSSCGSVADFVGNRGTMVPSVRPRRTFHAQTRRKPFRCQAATVSGLTRTNAERQLRQRRDKETQRMRSVEVSFGRVTERCSTPI